VGVVAVKGCECSSELFERQTSVTVVVVTSDPQFQLVRSRVNTNSIQSSTEIMGVNHTTVVGIEDVEGIRQVEVSLEHEVGFGSLECPFLRHELLHAAYEVVLLWEVEDRLPGGRHMGRRGDEQGVGEGHVCWSDG